MALILEKGNLKMVELLLAKGVNICPVHMEKDYFDIFMC